MASCLEHEEQPARDCNATAATSNVLRKLNAFCSPQPARWVLHCRTQVCGEPAVHNRHRQAPVVDMQCSGQDALDLPSYPAPDTKVSDLHTCAAPQDPGSPVPAGGRGAVRRRGGLLGGLRAAPTDRGDVRRRARRGGARRAGAGGCRLRSRVRTCTQRLLTGAQAAFSTRLCFAGHQRTGQCARYRRTVAPGRHKQRHGLSAHVHLSVLDSPVMLPARGNPVCYGLICSCTQATGRCL